MIFANRYYLRKLNLDGSNYTLLKQVRLEYRGVFKSLCASLLLLMQLLALRQGLNNAVALDFDYRQQMIYWTDVTTQGSMIRRMYINGSDVQVSAIAGREMYGQNCACSRENVECSSSLCDTSTESFALRALSLGPSSDITQQPRWPGSGLGGRKSVLV